MEPRNRFQWMNSAILCSLAGRYDNPIPTRFLAPIDFLKISALLIQGMQLIIQTAQILQLDSGHRFTVQGECCKAIPALLFNNLARQYNVTPPYQWNRPFLEQLLWNSGWVWSATEQRVIEAGRKKKNSHSVAVGFGPLVGGGYCID
jgi:hypothetical protein